MYAPRNGSYFVSIQFQLKNNGILLKYHKIIEMRIFKMFFLCCFFAVNSDLSRLVSILFQYFITKYRHERDFAYSVVLPTHAIYVSTDKSTTDSSYSLT